MSTEIYYFSGTGNSLHVAKELQKRIPDTKLIPVVSLLDDDIIQTSGESIGFVFPVHALTIPIAFKKFLRKIDPSSAKYIFAVATRYGTEFRGFKTIDGFLKKKNKILDSHFILNMGHNEEIRREGYKVPTEAEILKIESSVQERLDYIYKIIVNQETHQEKDTDYIVPVNYLMEKFVLSAMAISEYIGGVNYFYSDSKCTSCQTCEKVCLTGKIKIADKKPVWQKDVFCYMCYACVNLCPSESVQIKDIPCIKSYTKENGRYPHPYATANDILIQKSKWRYHHE